MALLLKWSKIVIHIEHANRPENDRDIPLPNYHEILDYLCREFGITGSPTLVEVVCRVKDRMKETGLVP